MRMVLVAPRMMPMVLGMPRGVLIAPRMMPMVRGMPRGVLVAPRMMPMVLPGAVVVLFAVVRCELIRRQQRSLLILPAVGVVRQASSPGRRRAHLAQRIVGSLQLCAQEILRLGTDGIKPANTLCAGLLLR